VTDVASRFAGQQMNYSVYVNAGVVLLLSQTLSPARKKDVLDTIAFATLAADEETCEESHHSQWFAIQSEVLSACGWSLYAHQETEEPPGPTEVSVSGREALVALANSSLVEGQAQLISQALDKVAQASLKGELTHRLRHYCLAGKAGNGWLRAMAGIVEEGGFLSMVCVSFRLHGVVNQCYFERDVAWVKPDGGISRRVYSARFNHGQYDEFRTDTVEWLAAEPLRPCVEIGVLPANA